MGAPRSFEDVIFITGDGEGIGKTTTARVVAALRRIEPCSSSAIIAADLERASGFPPGTISRARRLNPESFRRELGRHGDAMAAAGRPAGLLAVLAGCRLIEGIRRLPELEVAIAAARDLGLRPIVVHVTRVGTTASDITEADSLRAFAGPGGTIANDGSEADLERAVAALVASLPGPAAEQAARAHPAPESVTR